MKTTFISRTNQFKHSEWFTLALMILLIFSSWPSVDIAWTQQGRPFSASEIEDLVKNGVSEMRVAKLIEERGVNFELTPQLRSKLQSAGAGTNIIMALEKATTKLAKLREATKRKEEEKRTAEAKRKAEEEKAAEEKKRVDEVKQQQEEELRRAEAKRRETEAILAQKREDLVKKKAEEQEAIRRAEQKRKDDENRKREQEVARLKKQESARNIDLETTQTALAPPCSVGLQHVFQYDDGTRFNRRVSRRDGDLCVIGQSYYDKDWTLVKQIGRNGQEITSTQPEYPLVGEKWLPFPLAVGKEWQINYRARFSTRAGVGFFSNYFKVLSFEKVKTPAGNFATLKIRQEQRHGSGTSGVRYLWYAPEVEYYVKQEYARHESNPENYWLNVHNYELVSVARPKN